MLRLPSTQHSWLLLLFCTVPRANHLLRTVSPTQVSEFATAHDARVLHCLPWTERLRLKRLLVFPALWVRLSLPAATSTRRASRADRRGKNLAEARPLLLLSRTSSRAPVTSRTGGNSTPVAFWSKLNTLHCSGLWLERSAAAGAGVLCPLGLGCDRAPAPLPAAGSARFLLPLPFA